MANALKPSPAERLDRLERIIRRGRASYLAVGKALLEVKERDLYRLRGFVTFEAYCEQQWGFSARHADRQIAAFAFAQEQAKEGKPTPANECQARRAIAAKRAPARPTPPDHATLEQWPETSTGFGVADANRICELFAAVRRVHRKHAEHGHLEGILQLYLDELAIILKRLRLPFARLCISEL